jgi:hypothetical protein
MVPQYYLSLDHILLNDGTGYTISEVDPLDIVELKAR